jgi:hypothetical protein
LVSSESSWRTRIARGLSVRHWGIAAGAAPAAGYGLVSGRLVAIGNIIVAGGYYMLVAGGYTVVAAGRHPEDRPLLDGRPEERAGASPLYAWRKERGAAFTGSTLRTTGAFGLAGARPV